MRTLFLTIGCGGSDNPRVSAAPIWESSFLPLPVVSRIVTNDSFYVSGIAEVGCNIILAGGEWGTLLRVYPDGQVDSVRGRVPGARPRSRLEPFDSGRVLVWSNIPPAWGVVHPDLSVDPMTVLRHPWGGGVGGPVFPYRGGYLMVLFGDASVRRESPTPWIPAPQVYALGADGGKLDSIGYVQDRGGQFLSWAAARVASGITGDTLMLLNLADASLNAWAMPDHSTAWRSALPNYFQSLDFREETWEYPWVHVGGKRLNLVGALQAELAAIAQDGSIYALRNYEVKWRSVKLPRYFKIRGVWEVTARGLEHYTPRGELINRYSLPDGDDLDWIRPGRLGRVYLGFSDHVAIAQLLPDPGRCTALPARVTIDIHDSPPEE